MRLLILLLLISICCAKIYKINKGDNVLIETGNVNMNSYSFIDYSVIGTSNITVTDLDSGILFKGREGKIKRTNGRLRLSFTANNVIVKINKGKEYTPFSNNMMVPIVLFSLVFGCEAIPIGYSFCIILLICIIVMRRRVRNRMLYSSRGECPVCLDDMLLYKLNCEHELCYICLSKIKESSSTCPLCRELIDV